MPRKATRPYKYQREQQWMTECFKQPEGVKGIDVLENLHDFQNIIWNIPADTWMTQYDHTPDDMAILCSEGSDGWILSSQLEWLLNRLNEKQRRSLNIVANFCTPNNLRCLKEKMGEEIERLNIIMNIGLNVDGSVFVASSERSGSHWVLVSLDLTCNPTVL